MKNYTNFAGSFCNSGSSDTTNLPSSGPSSGSGHVTFSSDNLYSFPVSIFRHNSMQDGKTKGR